MKRIQVLSTIDNLTFTPALNYIKSPIIPISWHRSFLYGGFCVILSYIRIHIIAPMKALIFSFIYISVLFHSDFTLRLYYLRVLRYSATFLFSLLLNVSHPNIKFIFSNSPFYLKAPYRSFFLPIYP